MVGKPLAFHHAFLVSIQVSLPVCNYSREPAWMGRIRHLWGCDSRSDNAKETQFSLEREGLAQASLSVLNLRILGISPKRESGRLSERSLGRLGTLESFGGEKATMEVEGQRSLRNLSSLNNECLAFRGIENVLPFVVLAIRSNDCLAFRASPTFEHYFHLHGRERLITKAFSKALGDLWSFFLHSQTPIKASGEFALTIPQLLVMGTFPWLLVALPLVFAHFLLHASHLAATLLVKTIMIVFHRTLDVSHMEATHDPRVIQDIGGQKIRERACKGYHSPWRKGISVF
ncbi:hypothetical protein Lal_00035550 [Lupinus albus]|nr:hypothetical protein Lal_00035550 [Lupinus albus]